MVKNLKKYSVVGNYTPPSGPLNYEAPINNYSVKDSDDTLISNDPFASKLYPLNTYGPNGGYNLNISFNRPPLPVKPNQGPYKPNESYLLSLSNNFLNRLPKSPAIINTYIPLGGYKSTYDVIDTINKRHIFLPYLNSFNASTYTAYDILKYDNPTGSDGSLSQDSFIAKIGSKRLNFSLSERINVETKKTLTGGQIFNITVGSIDSGLQSRLSGSYFPTSTIPGDYFDDSNQPNTLTNQTANALNVVNKLTGGFLGPILTTKTKPSQVFINNSGDGQVSLLFNNLSYNRYSPGYDKKGQTTSNVGVGITSLLLNAVNINGDINSTYYVGSKTNEPSSITSPMGAVPITPFGEQSSTPVYGPSEIGQLFEGNIGQLNFGLAGKSTSNGGGLDGGLVWVSPKYKSNAGFHAVPGGGSGSKDDEFNQISSLYSKAESTNLIFKRSSILDYTQRLVDSADNVSGINRLKHVGNAINQVSKVFNDGYKEITKGSQVLSYLDNTTGNEKGIEYCRVFTKDTPYYTYADLQKTDGITTSGRRFTNSVLDNTFNLNIAPLKNPGSTNIQQNSKGDFVAKKYMFSIENLAWRTSSRDGFRYDDLPVCEKGPNGGRVMWFPPYDISFNDSSTANWQPTTFLGRPEPIYTYKDTNRTGSLSWKIIVDHPSIMNTIVDKQLKGKSKERIDSIINSFFAGCVKYDIYELAIKFNTIPVNELYTYQQILNNPRLTDVETVSNIIKNIPAGNSNNNNTPTSDITNNNNNKEVIVDPALDEFKNNYIDFGFYFDNDVPGPSKGTVSNVNFESAYNSYVSTSNIDEYVKISEKTFNDGSEKNVKSFFDNFVTGNYNKFCGGDKNFIIDAYNILEKKLGTITIIMEGSASATASNDYNALLSQRRIDSVRKFFETKEVGGKSLGKFLGKTFNIKSATGRGEDTVIPKSYTIDNKEINDSPTGQEVNCNQDIKDKNGVVTSNSQKYSTSAMACRRVKIKEIKIDPIPETKKDSTLPKEVVKPETATTQAIPSPKPQPTVSIEKKLKEGLSKKILRNLLSECDYFEVIKESDPMIYTSIKEKIKYFNPAFHSMTPEGLNARLVFLNQCMRPGETIPIIGTDGKPKNSDAMNTSFGAPPVLILRIGDFYNTKIIPNNLSITYDPLLFDINPEGIGVQPMIAKVTLTFNMIGGMGLAKPVEQLQNALSFNYYANTEIYDERATPTEDTSAIDKKVLDALLAKQPPVTVNNVVDNKQNDAASTIGEIISTVPLNANGETGEISYKTIMDKLLDNTKTYFTNIYNTLEEIVKQTNYGVLQTINRERNFKEGTLETNSPAVKNKTYIYGKPSNVSGSLDNLFNLAISDISSGVNPIISKLTNEKFTDESVITIIKNNLITYIRNVKSSMVLDVNNIVNNKLSTPQQEYIQYIRKLNFVNSLSDGKLLETGVPKIYNISKTDKVTNTGPNVVYADTYEEFYGDYLTVYIQLEEYLITLSNKQIIPVTTVTDGSFTPISKFNGSREDMTFFMVISRIFMDKNKVDDFKKQIMTANVKNVTKPKKLEKTFNKIVDDLVDTYSDEVKSEEKLYSKFKTDSEFTKYTKDIETLLYKKGKTRVFNFTTVPDPAKKDTQEKALKDLYAPLNPNTDVKTFDGKVKFN